MPSNKEHGPDDTRSKAYELHRLEKKQMLANHSVCICLLLALPLLPSAHGMDTSKQLKLRRHRRIDRSGFFNTPPPSLNKAILAWPRDTPPVLRAETTEAYKSNSLYTHLSFGHHPTQPQGVHAPISLVSFLSLRVWIGMVMR